MRDQPINPSDSWWPMNGHFGNRWYTDKVDQWEISPRELKSRLDRGDDIVLVDVREPWEFEIASLPESRLLPLGELERRIEEELDRDQEIVVYCHHGFRSLEAAMTLWNMGFDRVKNLSGGISRWADLVDPQMPRY